MREKTINGRVFELNPLKRGFLRKMRNDGMPLDLLPVEKSEEAMDLILEEALTEDEFKATDTLDNPDCIQLYREILRETFSSPDEEKNSSTSPDGSMTPGDESTASPAPATETAEDVTGKSPRPSTPET